MNIPMNLDFHGLGMLCGGVRSVSYRHLLESKSPLDIAREIVQLNDYYSGDSKHDNFVTQRILALNFAMKQVGGSLLDEVEKLLPEALRRQPSIYLKK